MARLYIASDVPRQRGLTAPLEPPSTKGVPPFKTLPKGVPPCGIRPKGMTPWNPVLGRLRRPARTAALAYPASGLSRPDTGERVMQSLHDYSNPLFFLAGARPVLSTSSPVAKTSDQLPEFHPQTVIRDWGDGNGFRLADAQTGVCVFGATGSGKTSGPAKHLAYGYLAHGFGGLVLCAKKEERRQWEEWAADCGRRDDLVIVDKSGQWRFNFLDWEASRPEEGGGLTINIVNLLDEIAGAIASSAGHGMGSSGSDKFWEDALHLMNTNLVDLVMAADLQVSLPLFRSIIVSAPYTLQQARDPEWEKTSRCAQIIAEADKATKKADEQARADFEECRNYWLKEFPNLSENTRSIIVLTLTMLVRPFITRPLRKLFSSDTNIRPEDAFDGKIIIIDLPVQEFRLAGRVANIAWKYCFQVAVLRRVQPADRRSFLRPVFLWADEAQNFISKFDSEYQAVARSASGCTVYLTQNRESYLRVLGNENTVDSLLGNLQAKFFCQNSGKTNEWASELLGKRWVWKNSTSVGQQRQDNVAMPQESNRNTSGVQRSEQERLYVEASEFTTLKRGGAMNDFQVEAIVYNGGYQFANGGNERLPYKLITFNQV